jgi:hypothetical protein
VTGRASLSHATVPRDAPWCGGFTRTASGGRTDREWWRTESFRRAAATAEHLQFFFGGALGAIDMFTAYLGLRLGLYQDLADHPGTTPGALARRTGIEPRYAREWLEQQTVTGIVDCADRAADEDDRTYSLPPGHAVALLVDVLSIEHDLFRLYELV